MNYREGMAEEDFILDMMDIIGRPSKEYIEGDGGEIVDFCVEWPMMENLSKDTLLDLLDYFWLDEYILENMGELVDVLSDYEVPEGGYYESEGELEAYPNDYKYKTREY